MTTCVAVNSARHGQPSYNSKVEYEKGIIMLADSRITYVGDVLPPEDDICKVDFLSDYAMAGFAGNVNVARIALPVLDDEFKKRPQFGGQGQIQRAGEILKDHYLAAPGRKSALHVLIGVRDVSHSTYRLFLLKSESDFAPQESSGLCAIGSGGGEFAAVYNTIFIDGQVLPRNPFTQSLMPIWGKNSFSNLLGEMLELQLKDAQEKSGPEAKIGGTVRLATLTDKGIDQAVGHQIFEDGIPGLTWYPELR